MLGRNLRLWTEALEQGTKTEARTFGLWLVSLYAQLSDNDKCLWKVCFFIECCYVIYRTYSLSLICVFISKQTVLILRPRSQSKKSTKI